MIGWLSCLLCNDSFILFIFLWICLCCQSIYHCGRVRSARVFKFWKNFIFTNISCFMSLWMMMMSWWDDYHDNVCLHSSLVSWLVGVGFERIFSTVISINYCRQCENVIYLKSCSQRSEMKILNLLPLLCLKLLLSESPNIVFGEKNVWISKCMRAGLNAPAGMWLIN